MRLVYIGLVKLFLRWILHIFTTQKETEIGWELTWMMHEIKDEAYLLTTRKNKL